MMQIGLGGGCPEKIISQWILWVFVLSKSLKMRLLIMPIFQEKFVCWTTRDEKKSPISYTHHSCHQPP